MQRNGSQHHNIASIAAPLAAALGCLQPGIDPVFLTILSQSSHLPLGAHGLIVAGTQTGAALGSLTVWWLGPRLPHRAVIFAALIALLCSLATAQVTDLAAILSLRCCYGVAMGMVYASAMSAYAARAPGQAFGAVFLIQLILSTLVSLALPEIERAVGAGAALAALALAPATALAALLSMGARESVQSHVDDENSGAAVPASGWAMAAATFWFICATMLVWSFSAAMATAAGIDGRTIGEAVAIGAIAGAFTALVVMRAGMVLPLPVTALLAGASLVSPILLIAPGSNTAFIVSIVLLNIGSTAIIIRCSSLAVATSANPRFRTFVACTHSLGLIAGPVLGSVMIALFGHAGLLAGLLLALTAGLAAVSWAALARPGVRLGHRSEGILPGTQMALD
jgi:hypothetical protein